LEKSSNGFFISEMDLRLRGPGVVLGYRQSGISEFALANILDDEGLLNLAREMAVAIVKSNPNLEGWKASPTPTSAWTTRADR
jgi:ATP-dependent DNA helicase RecG